MQYKLAIPTIAEEMVDQKLLSMAGILSGGVHFQVATAVVTALAMEKMLTIVRTVGVSPMKFMIFHQCHLNLFHDLLECCRILWESGGRLFLASEEASMCGFFPRKENFLKALLLILLGSVGSSELEVKEPVFCNPKSFASEKIFLVLISSSRTSEALLAAQLHLSRQK